MVDSTTTKLLSYNPYYPQPGTTPPTTSYYAPTVTSPYSYTGTITPVQGPDGSYYAPLVKPSTYPQTGTQYPPSQYQQFQTSLPAQISDIFGPYSQMGNLQALPNPTAGLAPINWSSILSSAPSLGSSPTAAQLLSTFQNALPKMPSLAQEFSKMGPAYISGRPQSYYDTQKQMLRDALSQEFFGPLGTVQQTASGESAAGRLGSGVGERVIQEAAIKPYISSFIQIDRDMQQLQMDEQARVQQFNAEQYNQYVDRLSRLRQSDQSVQLDLQKLAFSAAQAEAGRLSTLQIAQLESDMHIWETATEQFVREREILLKANTDYLNYTNDLRTIQQQYYQTQLEQRVSVLKSQIEQQTAYLQNQTELGKIDQAYYNSEIERLRVLSELANVDMKDASPEKIAQWEAAVAQAQAAAR